MRLALPYALLERPAVLVPVALMLLAASGGMMWTNITARRPAPVDVAQAPRAAAIGGLTAASDIARGQVVTARDLLVRPFALAHLPPGLLRQPAEAEGHMALAPIKAGAPLTAGALSATAVQGISGRVPQGFRAYALAVTESEIAGGFLQAGDRVDLYVTLPGALFGDAQKGDRSRSALLVPSVLVLAAGTRLDSDGTANPAMRTVTLALDAEALARVALAARVGAITLAIRNPADDAMPGAASAGIDTLLNAAPHLPRAHAGGRGIPVLMGARRAAMSVP